MRPRLLERYRKDVVPRLSREFSYGNVHEVPKLTKIVVNVGLGEATQNPKLLDNAVVELAAITGQRPAVTSTVSPLRILAAIKAPPARAR